MEKKQLLKLYLAQDWRKIPKVQGLTYSRCRDLLTSQVVPKTVAKYINHRWHQKDKKLHTVVDDL